MEWNDRTAILIDEVYVISSSVPLIIEKYKQKIGKELNKTISLVKSTKERGRNL